MQSLSTSIVSIHTAHLKSPEKETKLKKNTDKKPSIFYFLVLFYSFLSMGCGTGLIGPTLLKFSEQLNEPLSQTVYVLFSRSFGFLAGTLIGGSLIDYFPLRGRTLLTLSIFVMVLTTLVIPFVYSLILMIIVHLLWSISAGIVDNLAQILTIRHYDKQNVNPFLQALHGAFGIGAFVSPLIIAPFLHEDKPIDQWHYAYWIVGSFQLPNFFWILSYAIRDELCVKKIVEIDLENKEFVSEEKKSVEEKSQEKLSMKTGFILSLITLFIVVYVGTESAFGSYLHTYASLHLDLAKDIAAYMNSVFWASFAFGRLLGIPLSMKFSPLQMISADLIGSIVALGTIYIWNRSELFLWIGSIVFGLSAASIYPSAIGYTEKHVSITGKRMSLIAVGGSAGDALIPLIIGFAINSKYFGPISFPVISLIVSIASSFLFCCIVLCVRNVSQPQESK